MNTDAEAKYYATDSTHFSTNVAGFSESLSADRMAPGLCKTRRRACYAAFIRNKSRLLRPIHAATVRLLLVALFTGAIILAVCMCGRSGVDAANCFVQTFNSPRSFGVGSIYVHRVVAADFNRDGKLDIATTVEGSRRVVVLWGDGNGSFPTQTQLAVGTFSISLVSNDFNNDGNIDLAVASYSESSFYVYLGNGAGAFSGPLVSAAGHTPFTIASADLNGDGNLDIAAVNGSTVAVSLGDGSGRFAAPFEFGASAAFLALGDLNGDSHVDIVTDNGSNNISLFFGDGTGHFGAGTSIPVGQSPAGLATADLNNDHKLDVAVANLHDVSVLLGDGHGGFSQQHYPVETFAGAIKVGDINNDGNLDLVTLSGSTQEGYVSGLIGDGQGHFDSPFQFPTKRNPTDINVGDFNNDGNLDLVTTDYFDASVSVLDNGGRVNDVTPPTFSSAPDITVYANGLSGVNVAYSIVALDNSGRTPTLDCSIPSGSTFPIGTTAVICTATDTCGNSATRTFNVSVTCAPVDLSPLGDIQIAATSPSGAIVNYNALSAVAGVQFSIPSGSTFPIGTTHVTYVVTELCGNTLAGSLNVTVIDEPPVLSLPNNIYTNATSSAGRVVYYTATVSDPVSGNIPLTCDHPSGSTFAIGQTIVTCSATDSINQTTNQSFNIYVSGCIGCTLPDFAGGVQYGVGSIPGRIAVDDFNKDGKPDMAVTSPDSSFVAVFLGTGNGQFGPPSYLQAGFFSVPVMSGDFNRDNNPDLAVGASDGTVWIYLGDGGGGFSGPTTFDDGPGYAYEMVVDDFNRDGKQDLAIGHQSAGLAVLFGDGSGAFSAPTFYIEDQQPVQVRKADFNNDGKIDIVTSNASGGASILLGDGNGGFSVASLDVPRGGIGVGDFNSDGKIDLMFSDATAFSGNESNLVSLYLGNGSGGFTFANSYLTNGNFCDMEAADFNKDGKLDVAIVGYDTISVLSGDGMGHFSAPLILPTLSNPVDINVSDLNADGKPDISTADYYDGTVSVFLNLTVLQTAVTQTGSNVTVQTIAADLAFTNVTTAGVTSVTPISDPATAGDTPGGFAISDSIAFEVSTTASFSGPVTTCFNVTSVNDALEFNNLRVLHKEGDQLIDRTSAHDFLNRKICATTTSFSPFYLATVSRQIQSLFDRSKAFKSGSTIPVKIKILNGSGQNLSSSALAVSVRGLRRIGNATASVVNDAGNANPDYSFRYDSGLQGYIYNLKTTGLAAGKYALSVYAGFDHSFFYTLTFDIR